MSTTPSRTSKAWPALIEALIDEFLEDYEMVGETQDGRDACYQLTDGDKALIKDAVMGLLRSARERAVVASSPTFGEQSPSHHCDFPTSAVALGAAQDRPREDERLDRAKAAEIASRQAPAGPWIA